MLDSGGPKISLYLTTKMIGINHLKAAAIGITLECRHLRIDGLRYFDENRIVQPRFNAKRHE